MTGGVVVKQVASFPFLAQLKLRTAINLSAEPLHEKVVEFFESEGVSLVRPIPRQPVRSASYDRVLQERWLWRMPEP